MARIRTIKPEFWVSEQIAECSTSARLLFVGLWNFCDDAGVHPAKPKTLKAELFPMDDITTGDVAGWMAELIKVGLVLEFEGGDGENYWHVTGWAKHQKIDRPSVKYPSPPPERQRQIRRALVEAHPSGDISFAEDSTNGLEESPNTRRGPPPGMEGKGKERRVVTSPTARRSDTAPPKPVGVEVQTWDDWLELRRRKRAPVTATVLKGAEAEAKKAGMPFNAFLEVWCTRGSQGLQASWLTPEERAGSGGAGHQRNGHEQPGVLDGDPEPTWAIEAGFPNRWQATNAGCGPGNFREYRDGRKIA